MGEAITQNTQKLASNPAKNGGTLIPITRDNARAMQAKSVIARRNKAMRAAQDRVVRRLAAADPTIDSPYAAWGELVADQAEALRQAASEGKPRGDDMMQVGQAMGMTPMPYEVREETRAHAPTSDAWQALATALLDAARMEADRAHAIEGKVSE